LSLFALTPVRMASCLAFVYRTKATQATFLYSLRLNYSMITAGNRPDMPGPPLRSHIAAKRRLSAPALEKSRIGAPREARPVVLEVAISPHARPDPATSAGTPRRRHWYI